MFLRYLVRNSILVQLYPYKFERKNQLYPGDLQSRTAFCSWFIGCRRFMTFLPDLLRFNEIPSVSYFQHFVDSIVRWTTYPRKPMHKGITSLGHTLFYVKTINILILRIKYGLIWPLTVILASNTYPISHELLSVQGTDKLCWLEGCWGWLS